MPKKLAPCKGYVLVKFDVPAGVPKESVNDLFSAKVIEEGGREITNSTNVMYSLEFNEGEIIYFQSKTGQTIPLDDGYYSFVRYSDIYGKEQNE